MAVGPARSSFAFVDGALDRADALRDDAAALAALWPAAGVIALDPQGRALADADGGLLAIDGSTLGGDHQPHTFLGLRGEQAWFLADAPGIGVPQQLDLRSAAAQWPHWQATLFAQARALQHWHRQHRFCGACGGALRYVRAGWLGRCDACASEHYPRTDQAIIVAVSDGARLLLGRQASWPQRRWSVIAGFVEPGETLEQTVAREVMEETGIRVDPRSARYLASQPWPFPSALMLGFIAAAAPDEPRVGDELEAARWFSVEQVREGLARDWSEAEREGEGIVLPAPLSIARHVIQTWLDGQTAG
ncbi:MAG: NAD(+) diphosphatase [Thermomonas sp.]|uniref:NAD(+) diphosphatase n=1 Tax=Thermomonas sp. TaxID=1971895 RepID=UPI001D29AF8D|nr:NAD(+) diphosphatase [Thermomonas sp.]MBZ0087512.1 NAD(+) diphosphatase [Thermomonas sp.]